MNLLDSPLNIKTSYPYEIVSVSGSNDDLLSLTEIKEWLRIDPSDNSEDNILLMLRDGVITFAEEYTSKTFLTTTFRTTRDQFSNQRWIELRKCPYDSLTSFQYFVNGVLTAVPANLFYVEKTIDYPNIRLNEGQTWPQNQDGRLAAIEIEFVAGSGAISSGIKVALLNHIASWYEKRGDCDDCSCESALPSASKQVYGQEKIMKFGKPSNERAQRNQGLF